MGGPPPGGGIDEAGGGYWPPRRVGVKIFPKSCQIMPKVPKIELIQVYIAVTIEIERLVVLRISINWSNLPIKLADLCKIAQISSSVLGWSVGGSGGV